MATLFGTVREVSGGVSTDRTPELVLTKSIEELGELSREIMIARGYDDRVIGDDGVIGEAIDVVITMFDIIYLTNPNISEEELVEIAKRKTNKWKARIGENNAVVQ